MLQDFGLRARWHNADDCELASGTIVDVDIVLRSRLSWWRPPADQRAEAILVALPIAGRGGAGQVIGDQPVMRGGAARLGPPGPDQVVLLLALQPVDDGVEVVVGAAGLADLPRDERVVVPGPDADLR